MRYAESLKREIKEGLEEYEVGGKELRDSAVLAYSGSIEQRRLQYLRFVSNVEVNRERSRLLMIVARRSIAESFGLREEYVDPGLKGFDFWYESYQHYLDSLDLADLVNEVKLMIKASRKEKMLVADRELNTARIFLERRLRLNNINVIVEGKVARIEFGDQKFELPLLLYRGENREIGFEELPFGDRTDKDWYKTWEECLSIYDLDCAYDCITKESQQDYKRQLEFQKSQQQEIGKLVDYEKLKNLGSYIIEEEVVGMLEKVTSYGAYVRYSYAFMEVVLANQYPELYDYLVKGIEPVFTSELDKVKFSQGVGLYLAGVADRSCADTNPIIVSGLFENKGIKKAFDKRCKKQGDYYWGGEYDPIRDHKVVNLYSYLFEKTSFIGTLDAYMRFADYVAGASFFKLDITRANDPSVLTKDFYSGVGVHNEANEGYSAGIYFGVLSGHYYWNERKRTVMQDVPLKFFSGVCFPNELICDGERLDVKNINRRNLFEDQLPLTNWRVDYDQTMLVEGNLSYVPYSVDGKKFERYCFSEFISKDILDAVRKYYPEARLEMKKITFITDIESIPKDKREIKVSIPFVVLPFTATENPLKVHLLKKFCGISNNLLIERE